MHSQLQLLSRPPPHQLIRLGTRTATVGPTQLIRTLARTATTGPRRSSSAVFKRQANMKDQDGPILGRVKLYGIVLANMIGWAAYQLLARLLRGAHPMKWSAEQDFNIMLLRTLFTNGTYVHWRNFTSLWLFLNGKAEQRGLRMERLPSSTFGVPGCRGSWLMSLGPELLQGAPPAKASCVMLFLHGGAFMAGDPRMYCVAFRHWMQQLAAQGIRMRVLSVGYPLSPEHPHPAPILAGAASYRWLMQRLKEEGSSESVILAGDSAGGNLVMATLAHLRDSNSSNNKQGAAANSSPSPPAAGDVDTDMVVDADAAASSLPPPAGAILISPAIDFTSSSVFGPCLAEYFAGQQTGGKTTTTHQQQQQQQQQQEKQEVPCSSNQPPPGSEWDYVGVSEGVAVAQMYVRATSQAEMDTPDVSACMLGSYKGLVQQGLLLMYGAIEVMAPDIAKFADRVRAERGGVVLQEHAEENEPHVYCVLPFKEVIERGARVVVPWVAKCATAAAAAGQKAAA